MKRSRHIPARYRRRVLKRAAGVCQVRWDGCGWDHDLEVHHRRMFAYGGVHRPANLVLACRQCHVKVHSRPWCAEPVGLLLARNPVRNWLPFWRRAVAKEYQYFGKGN